MVTKSKLIALRENYDAFIQRLPDLLAGHEGEYALMRHGDIVDYFRSPREALLAGRGRFADDLFSVQEIRRSAADLGWFSRAPDNPSI